MNVSLFSDASYDDLLCVGGWGGWAKSDRGTTTAGGAFRTMPGNVEQAEAYAMANTIAHAIASGIVRPGDRIVMGMDNLGVLSLMRGERPPHSDWQRVVLDFVRRRRETLDLSFDFRHVKAHRRHRGGRHLVNDLCDRMAKEGLAEARRNCEVLIEAAATVTADMR